MKNLTAENAKIAKEKPPSSILAFPLLSALFVLFVVNVPFPI